jgi:hypothetical protein
MCSHHPSALDPASVTDHGLWLFWRIRKDRDVRLVNGLIGLNGEETHHSLGFRWKEQRTCSVARLCLRDVWGA